MKRVIACAGAFAIGVAGLLGANVTGLTPQEQLKWWTLSGSLRGFYDDNSLNQVNALALPSYGIEFSPGISIHLPTDRTLVNASYNFTLNYYEARPDSKVDQDHIFNARVNHKFTERYSVNLEDAFTYSDSPEVLDPGNPTARRGNATGFINRALVDFDARLTPVLGVTPGYKNTWRDYQQSGFTQSYSAYLDSVEHLFHIDANWYVSQTTFWLVGYQVGVFNYTSSDPIGSNTVVFPNPLPPPNSLTNFVPVLPDTRNNHSHYVYIGANRDFSRQLSGAAKVGVRFTDYYNVNQTAWSPYADMKLSYTYLPGSQLQTGLAIDRQPVDVGALDALAETFYISVHHQFSYRISGLLDLNYQHTKYNGGQFDNDLTDYVTIDSRLAYKLRENLFLDLGYVWYGYFSDVPGQNFKRNRVYLGIRAVY